MALKSSQRIDSLRLDGGGTWTRRHWIILSVGFIFFALIAPGISVFLPIWDTGPVEDSDMMITPQAVPVEQNAWPELVELYHTLQPKTPNEFHDWWREPEAHRKEISEWVQETALKESLAFLYQKPFCHPPFTISRKEWDDEISILEYFHRSFRLLLVIQETVENQYDIAKLQIRFFDAIHTGPKSTFGLIFHNFYITAFAEDLLKYGGIEYYSAPRLKALSSELNLLKTDWDTTWKWATLRDYQYLSANLPESDAREFWGDQPAPWITRQIALPFLYQKNRTQALFLEAHRADLFQLAPVTFPYPEARSSTEIYKGISSANNSVEEFLTYARFFPNMNGKIIFLEFASNEFERRKSIEAEQQWSLISIELSLRLLQYERNHDQWPGSLENQALNLPDRLKTDPFDGKSIRYRPSRRLFYSVGYNGKDDDGQISERRFEGDLVVQIPMIQ